MVIMATKYNSYYGIPKTSSRNVILFVQLSVAKLNSFDVEYIAQNHKEMYACNQYYKNVIQIKPVKSCLLGGEECFRNFSILWL